MATNSFASPASTRHHRQARREALSFRPRRVVAEGHLQAPGQLRGGRIRAVDGARPPRAVAAGGGARSSIAPAKLWHASSRASWSERWCDGVVLLTARRKESSKAASAGPASADVCEANFRKSSKLEAFVSRALGRKEVVDCPYRQDHKRMRGPLTCCNSKSKVFIKLRRLLVEGTQPYPIESHMARDLMRSLETINEQQLPQAAPLTITLDGQVSKIDQGHAPAPNISMIVGR